MYVESLKNEQKSPFYIAEFEQSFKTCKSGANYEVYRYFYELLFGLIIGGQDRYERYANLLSRAGSIPGQTTEYELYSSPWIIECTLTKHKL